MTEHRKRYMRNWRAKNRAKIRATERAWNKRNPDKVKAKYSKWLAKNFEKWRHYLTRWKKDHPDRVFAYNLRWLSRRPEVSLFPTFVRLDELLKHFPGYESHISIDSLSPADMLMMKEDYLNL